MDIILVFPLFKTKRSLGFAATRSTVSKILDGKGRLSLKDFLEMSDFEKLNKLKELELISFEGKVIKPSSTLYRIPNSNISSPRSVAKASDYILKHIDLYISKEGSPNQELKYYMLMVEPHVAETILQQLNSFSLWVNSVGSTKTDDTVVPIVFFGFTKILERKDL